MAGLRDGDSLRPSRRVFHIARKTTIQRLEELAQAGNPAAQYYIGMAFNNGLGVKKNPHTAFEWFKKAARGGDPLAAYKVGC